MKKNIGSQLARYPTPVTVIGATYETNHCFFTVGCYVFSITACGQNDTTDAPVTSGIVEETDNWQRTFYPLFRWFDFGR